MIAHALMTAVMALASFGMVGGPRDVPRLKPPIVYANPVPRQWSELRLAEKLVVLDRLRALGDRATLEQRSWLASIGPSPRFAPHAEAMRDLRRVKLSPKALARRARKERERAEVDALLAKLGDIPRRAPAEATHGVVTFSRGEVTYEGVPTGEVAA